MQTQITELSELVHDHRSTTEGSRIAHQGELKALREKVDNIGIEHCDMQSDVRIAVERIDSRFSNMSDGIYSHADRVTAEIAELAKRVDAEHKRVGNLYDEALRDHKALVVAEGNIHELSRRIDTNGECVIRANQQLDELTRFGEAQERILGHHRGELDKLEELDKRVDDHRSTTEGCLIAHQPELKAYYHATDARADNSGPPACSAPAPAAACEHLAEQRNYSPHTGYPMAVCECGDLLYLGNWYSQHPSGETPPAPASAACEHPKEGCKIRDILLCNGIYDADVCGCGAVLIGDTWHVPQPSAAPPEPACTHPVRLQHRRATLIDGHAAQVVYCRLCRAARLNGEWFTPQSSAAPPEPACEHPKTQILVRNRTDDVAVTECISCKAVCVQGTWYTPEPSGKADEGS